MKRLGGFGSPVWAKRLKCRVFVLDRRPIDPVIGVLPEEVQSSRLGLGFRPTEVSWA